MASTNGYGVMLDHGVPLAGILPFHCDACAWAFIARGGISGKPYPLTPASVR
jgi:hypothetical protein